MSPCLVFTLWNVHFKPVQCPLVNCPAWKVDRELLRKCGSLGQWEREMQGIKDITSETLHSIMPDESARCTLLAFVT
jgi:hypothetical protein